MSDPDDLFQAAQRDWFRFSTTLASHKASAVFQDIALLLTASHYVMEPTIQNDWTGVFAGLFRQP